MTTSCGIVCGMADGQRNDIIAIILDAVPKLSFEEAQAIIYNKELFVADIGEVFNKWRDSKPTVPAPQSTSLPIQAVGADFKLTIPADGEEFELTFGSTDPMQMVQGDGYDPRGWEFKGAEVIAPQTRRFKLVRVEYCGDLDEVRQELQAHGNIPEGQWRETFKRSFSHNDVNNPIGFADPKWVDSDGYVRFPVLNENGSQYGYIFFWAARDRQGRWRWLVESK